MRLAILCWIVLARPVPGSESGPVLTVRYIIREASNHNQNLRVNRCSNNCSEESSSKNECNRSFDLNHQFE